MLIQLCYYGMPCLSQILRSLQNHALLNLEMIQVQKVKWYIKLNSIWRISYLAHVWLEQLDKYLTSKPVMVIWEFSSHWR